MRTLYITVGSALIIAALVAGFFVVREEPEVSEMLVESVSRIVSPTQSQKPEIDLVEPSQKVALPATNQVFQTFNNCGPATLSMALSAHNVTVDQITLGNQIRPYQIASGDNDDKSVFPYEFVLWAQEYDMEGVHRVNGSIDKMKIFLANGFPVVVRTWLNPGEDIGHYRVIRGYDDTTGTILQDDSYQGPNLTFSYADFNAMWQPFNYEYVVIYPTEKEEVIQAILGEEASSEKAYANALDRAHGEIANGDTLYAYLNLARNYYHVGEYQEAIEAYETVAARLPSRTLWYHREPFQMYQKAGQTDTALAMIQRVLNNHNKAYAELYVIRGEIFQEQGNLEAARFEYQTALLYNKNYREAQEKLEQL